MGVVHAVEEEDALGRLVHAADDVELGGLAEENEEPALAHVEARALDDLHGGLSGAVGPLHAAKGDMTFFSSAKPRLRPLSSMEIATSMASFPQARRWRRRRGCRPSC